MSYDTAIAQTATNGTTSWMDSIIHPEPWVQDAACREVEGNLWFVEGKGKQYTEARSICDRCSVVAACFEYALRTDQTEGMWAGLSPIQRAALARAS